MHAHGRTRTRPESAEPCVPSIGVLCAIIASAVAVPVEQRQRGRLILAESLRSFLCRLVFYLVVLYLYRLLCV